jgi:hypothetical protein
MMIEMQGVAVILT